MREPVVDGTITIGEPFRDCINAELPRDVMRLAAYSENESGYRRVVMWGWPVAFISATLLIDDGYQVRGGFADTELNESLSFPSGRIIPYRVHWLNAAIAGLVVGTAARFAAMGVGTFVRWRRVRAGKCPMCRYPWVGPVCPECGFRSHRDARRGTGRPSRAASSDF